MLTGGGQSVFDGFTSDDLIMAFFPCIYFESLSMMAFSLGCTNYRKLTQVEAMDKIIEREKNRTYFYTIILKFIRVVLDKKLRLIIENPWSMQHYFKQGNFPKNPDLVDMDRTLRGDYFRKPTAYWYWNCDPTHGLTICRDKKRKTIQKSKPSGKAGVCSEDRSMISSDYARNFICDFILGKPQKMSQLSIF